MTMIAALAREDFPAASRCTYLNSASVALMSASAAKAAIDWQQDIADNGTLNFDEIAEDRVYDDLRLSFGRLVQADADSIAVGSSATELLSSLAWSIAPKQGQNIVSVDAVFPSTSYPWMRVARATGSEMRWVHTQDGLANESDIISAIDKSTAVVSISHVEYASGQRYNLEAIATAAHSHGALLIVDATQSAGAIPIDVGQESVDALVTGSYKWLCGPFGVGLMYLTPRLQESLDPGIVGWRSHKEIYDLQADRLEYVQTARRFEASTMAYGCAVGLATAIGLLERIGIERIYQHNIELADELIDAVRSEGGQIVAPPGERTSIVSMRIGGLDSGRVIRHLGERDIIASSRRGNVRLSLHLYNGSEDVTQVKEALRELRRA